MFGTDQLGQAAVIAIRDSPRGTKIQTGSRVGCTLQSAVDCGVEDSMGVRCSTSTSTSSESLTGCSDGLAESRL
jgi:hypothetical protein